MSYTFAFTAAEQSQMVNSLRVAAEKFDDNARVMDEERIPKLAEQFRRQAAEARAIASRIENEGEVG